MNHERKIEIENVHQRDDGLHRYRERTMTDTDTKSIPVRRRQVRITTIPPKPKTEHTMKRTIPILCLALTACSGGSETPDTSIESVNAAVQIAADSGLVFHCTGLDDTDFAFSVNPEAETITYWDDGVRYEASLYQTSTGGSRSVTQPYQVHVSYLTLDEFSGDGIESYPGSTSIQIFQGSGGLMVRDQLSYYSPYTNVFPEYPCARVEYSVASVDGMMLSEFREQE